jgi:hypothetical protein
VVIKVTVDPYVAIQSPMVNTGHYVALWALPLIDALAIKNDLERILNGVEQELVAKRDSRRAYNDRD